MPSRKSSHAKVKRTRFDRSGVAAGLDKVDAIVRVGSKCPKVQECPAMAQALAGVGAAAEAARARLRRKQQLAQALETEQKGLRSDVAALLRTLRLYEAFAEDMAAGDGAKIASAGLPVRHAKTPPAALAPVTSVRSRPGKLPGEAIVSWPPAPGATTYAIEVGLDPTSRQGPWTPLPAGTRRRRVIKGPGPGSQLLAHVGAVAGDGTQAAWSDPILVTTR
jgi:hypothetical protein